MPFPFASGDELLTRCVDSGLAMSSLMLANEAALLVERFIGRAVPSRVAHAGPRSRRAKGE